MSNLTEAKKTRVRKRIEHIKSGKKFYLKKSDFCSKYNITIKRFNEVLIEKGLFTKKQHRSMDCSTTEILYQPTDLVKKKILKMSGTWQNGIFAYEEKYFITLFMDYSDF